MSWRFNGGRGAVTCDLCSYILKEPAKREDSKNPDGDDLVAAKLDLCVDIARCKIRQLRQSAKTPSWSDKPFGSARKLSIRIVDFCVLCEIFTENDTGLTALVQLGDYGEPV